MPFERSDEIQEHIDRLTTELERRQARVLALTKRTLLSFHGAIGSKNDQYAGVINRRYQSPSDYVGAWLEGFRSELRADEQKARAKGYSQPADNAAQRLRGFFRHEIVFEYLLLFLERNFFRQYHERTRAKPSEALWEIWFGDNSLTAGLFITPRYQSKRGWHNDVSEIRRTKFRYWTIEHVLTTGVVIDAKRTTKDIEDLDDLFAFYHRVIQKTKSPYASQFACLYEKYARSSDEPEQIPFLIPEFRFEGKSIEHRYRLDFTILCADRDLRLGIELSPWSTHGSGLDDPAMRRQWEREMDKRNKYFQSFGITTLTFTNRELADPSTCFEELVEYLGPASGEARSLPEVEADVRRYCRTQ